MNSEADHIGLQMKWKVLSAKTNSSMGRSKTTLLFLGLFCSLSSGEDHLEKLSEMERILHQAQGEKMRMLEQQVSSL